MFQQLLLTTPEAAFVLERSTREVKRSIDRGEVPAGPAAQDDPPRRRLDFVSLVYLTACSRLSGKLATGARNEFHAKLREQFMDPERRSSVQIRWIDTKGSTSGAAGSRSAGPGAVSFWAATADRCPRVVDLGWGSVNIAPDLERLLPRLLLLEEVKANAAYDPKGEPIIPGTAIEVHRIAALLDGGADADAVREEHPDLTDRQIDWVRAYAAAYPKRGRPFPRKGLKRQVRDLGLDALDEVLGAPGKDADTDTPSGPGG